jgi:hypothetical protein
MSQDASAAAAAGTAYLDRVVAAAAREANLSEQDARLVAQVGPWSFALHCPPW